MQEGGLSDSDEPMPQQPPSAFVDTTIGRILATHLELQQLRQLLTNMRMKSEETRRRHEIELEASRARVKALIDKNAKPLARNTDLLARASWLSTKGIPTLDDVMECTMYGLLEPTISLDHVFSFVV